MRLEYIGLSELSGSLIALEGVTGAAYDEISCNRTFISISNHNKISE